MPKQFDVFALFHFDMIIDFVGKNKTMHLFFWSSANLHVYC